MFLFFSQVQVDILCTMSPELYICNGLGFFFYNGLFMSVF